MIILFFQKICSPSIWRLLLASREYSSYLENTPNLNLRNTFFFHKNEFNMENNLLILSTGRTQCGISDQRGKLTITVVIAVAILGVVPVNSYKSFGTD